MRIGMNDTTSQIMIPQEMQRGREVLSSCTIGGKLQNTLYQTSKAINFFPFYTDFKTTAQKGSSSTQIHLHFFHTQKYGNVLRESFQKETEK